MVRPLAFPAVSFPALGLVLACAMPLAPLWAQDAIRGEAQTGSPPDRIDILVPPADGGHDPLAQEQCEQEQEAGDISGEIVVCRGRNRGTTDGNWNRQRWGEDYARETAYANDPQAPDVDNTRHPFAGAGFGIVITGCFVPPCPGPHPVMIDIESLPPPPEGSDAERIAQGLDPIGHDGEPGERTRELRESELGLPPSRYADEREDPAG